MVSKKPIILALAIVLLVGLSLGNVQPAHAACNVQCFRVALDAANTSQQDVAVATTASNVKAFRIGAVIQNVSSTNPVANFYGWQFSINYNNTAFVPQGDVPFGVTYPDGASNTAIYGGQTTAGTANWAGRIAASSAFGVTSFSKNVGPGVDQVTVAFTSISPAPAFTVTATTLLASVSFELLARVSPSLQSFTITNVIFVDNTGNNIPGAYGGADITEGVTDIPPVARIVATPEPNGSPDCVPVTGLNCTADAVKFDGSTSTAESGTIADPGGYFFDYGDGVVDAGVGSIAIHDYGTSGAVVPGMFNVTLRVQDTAADTGSARDGLGGVVINNQPSHTQILNLAVPPATTTVPVVTVNAPTPDPANTGSTVTITFSVTSSDTVTSLTVDWGDGTSPDSLAVSATSDTHTYASTGSTTSKAFTITVTATNSVGPGSGTTTETVNDRSPTVTISNVSPSPANTGQVVTITFSATDPDGTIASFSVNWGDGTSPDSLGPSATSDTHTYSTASNPTFTITVSGTDNSGSTGQDTRSLTVTVPVNVPVVTVNAPTPKPVNTGALVTVTFSVSSSATVTSLTVNWGDGTAPDNLAVSATSDTHTYASTGTSTSKSFTITVTAVNSAGPGSGTTTETVNDRVPTVTISNVSPSPATTGQLVTVTFSAADPDGTIASFSVNWGDGTTPDSLGASATSDTHTYTIASSPTFTITVTATDNSGSTGQATQSLTVTNPVGVPVVTVNAPTPKPANTGQTVTVTFSVTSTATVTSLTVDWGDATTPDSLAVSATSGTHTYTSTGASTSKSFTITVTATNSAGPGSGTTTETVNDRPPTVTISTVSPNPANTGALVTVSFTTADPDGTVSAISVDWGDGTSPDSLSGSATSGTHTYANTGNSLSKAFTITITATDNSGSTGQSTSSVTINDRSPLASFTFSPSAPAAGQTVTFNAAASTDPDGTISSYAWDFGDSTTGTGSSPTHTYNPSSTTTFTIQLTVTDNSGNTGTLSKQVTVTVTTDVPPTCTIGSVSPATANTGQMITVNFSCSDSDGTINAISVDWGDGTTPDSLAGSATSDTHTYSSTGSATSMTFTITVSARDDAGLTGSKTTSAIVNDRPPVVTISNVSPSPATTGQLVTVTFSATDPDGSITSFSVNWGDGTSPDSLGSSATSDTHTYSTASSPTFTITVTATDNSSSTGQATTPITVTTPADVPPTCSISSISPNPATTGQTVTASFSCTDHDGTVTSISVDWGDGSSPDNLAGSATSDTHGYASMGTFTITVTATDDAGLTGHVTASETVTPPVITTGDFSISVNPSRIAASGGSSRSVTVVVHSLNNFSGDVSLSFTITPVFPNGPAGILSKTIVTLKVNASANAKLTLSTTSSTPSGSYNVTVTGVSGELSHSDSLTLAVRGGFSIRGGSNNLSIEAGSNEGFNLSINSRGFSGRVLLTANLSPSDNNSPSISLDHIKVLLSHYDSANVVVTISTDDNTSTGTFTILIIGTGHGQTSFFTRTLTISPPSSDNDDDC